MFLARYARTANSSEIALVGVQTSNYGVGWLVSDFAALYLENAERMGEGERERERALSLQSLIIKIMYELSICAKERPKLTSTRNKFTGAQRSANVSPTNLLVSLLQTVTS